MEPEIKSTGMVAFLRQWLQKLATWLKPDPADRPLPRVLKLFGKFIALLLMIAFSPIILVVLVFVFFAAI